MHDKLIIIKKKNNIKKKKNRKVQKPGGCESKTMTAIPMSKKSQTEKEKTKQQKWR